MKKILAQFPFLRSVATEALIIYAYATKKILLLMTWSFLLFRKQTPSPTPLGNNN